MEKGTAVLVAPILLVLVGVVLLVLLVALVPVLVADVVVVVGKEGTWQVTWEGPL